ncbi:hypothetical protein J6590_000959 [Homalodisca vitripennis]|nr:hypothetical protein J6590_000959 [Homalodisca vitripennis]
MPEEKQRIENQRHKKGTYPTITTVEVGGRKRTTSENKSHLHKGISLGTFGMGRDELEFGIESTRVQRKNMQDE